MRRPLKIIKIGGALLACDPAELWNQIHILSNDASIVVVHGGGIQATELSRALGHEPTFVNGRRITSALDLQVLQWAVRGEINSGLVAAAHACGLHAVGLSGADGGMISVKRRPVWTIEEREVDFGFVGDVMDVRTEAIEALIQANIIPVIAPLGIDAQGGLYNVNADTVAIELAVALGAEELIFVTEVGGVLPGDMKPGVLAHIDQQGVNRGVMSGWISEGMHMKLTAAIDGHHRGISSIRITDTQGISVHESGTHILEQSIC